MALYDPAMTERLRRTWDGLEIAADRPTGSTVVVRRRGSRGETEVLVLHRNARGPGFEGDWAWTSPAGCRQPGEAVLPGALRELSEEAGLDGLAPWAVDLSGAWSCFAVDLPDDGRVELIDPEHDRFAWVSPDQAAGMVLPAFVAAQQGKAARAPSVALAFRPMEDGDFAAVARWQRARHVREWWDHRSPDEESVRARYAPRLRGEQPTRMWVVEVDGTPAGFLQDYRVQDYPDYAVSTRDPDAVGFDYAIGEPALVDRGIGTRMVWEFCRDILRVDYPDAAHILSSPSHRNHRSLRVLAKCGFRQGWWIDEVTAPAEPADAEIVCTLDVRHWLG